MNTPRPAAYNVRVFSGSTIRWEILTPSGNPELTAVQLAAPSVLLNIPFSPAPAYSVLEFCESTARDPKKGLPGAEPTNLQFIPPFMLLNTLPPTVRAYSVLLFCGSTTRVLMGPAVNPIWEPSQFTLQFAPPSVLLNIPLLAARVPPVPKPDPYKVAESSGSMVKAKK